MEPAPPEPITSTSGGRKRLPDRRPHQDSDAKKQKTGNDAAAAGVSSDNQDMPQVGEGTEDVVPDNWITPQGQLLEDENEPHGKEEASTMALEELVEALDYHLHAETLVEMQNRSIRTWMRVHALMEAFCKPEIQTELVQLGIRLSWNRYIDEHLNIPEQAKGELKRYEAREKPYNPQKNPTWFFQGPFKARMRHQEAASTGFPCVYFKACYDLNSDKDKNPKDWEWGTELAKEARDPESRESFMTEFKTKATTYNCLNLKGHENSKVPTVSSFEELLAHQSSFVLPEDKNEPFWDKQASKLDVHQIIHALVYLVRADAVSVWEKREETLRQWMRVFALKEAYDKLDEARPIDDLPAPANADPRAKAAKGKSRKPEREPKSRSRGDKLSKGHVTTAMDDYAKQFVQQCEKINDDKSRDNVNNWDWGSAEKLRNSTNDTRGLEQWQIGFRTSFNRRIDAYLSKPKETSGKSKEKSAKSSKGRKGK